MKLDLALTRAAAERQAAEHRQAAAALTDPLVWQKRRHHTECAGRAEVLVDILRTLPGEVDQEMAKQAAKGEQNHG